MNNGFSSCEEDSRGGPSDQICCLYEDGLRCSRPAGYASYSSRIQKTVTQRRLKLTVDNSGSRFICDYHKNRIQSARTKRRRKDSEDDSNGTDSEIVPEVDLVQLQMNTLRRYKRHFKVAMSARQGLNKPQLAETIMEHFKQIPVQEKEVLTYFIYMVKSNHQGQ